MDLASDFGDLDDQMVWVPIGDIHPWDKNPRDNDTKFNWKHSKMAIDKKNS